MKKVLIMIASMCMLSVLAYAIYFTQSLASNNLEGTEYDYYKNKREKKKKTKSMEAGKESAVPDSKAVMIDTTPDSVTVLINKELGLPEDYVPENLVVPEVRFSFSGYQEKKLMREDAAAALEELFLAAEEEGLSLFAVSGYRSYARQKGIYERNVAKNGAERTNQFSAKPGYSEHQSGLTMDVSTNSINYRLDEAFGGTPEGKFLAEHAHEYGFIIRYPEGKSDITGFAYEPWHIRYVGKELAKELFEDGITMEEYYGYTPSEKLQDEKNYGTAIDVEEIEETP